MSKQNYLFFKNAFAWTNMKKNSRRPKTQRRLEKTNNLNLVRGLAHICLLQKEFLTQFSCIWQAFFSIVWMSKGKMGTRNGLNLD